MILNTMFDATTYQRRRNSLAQELESGVALFPGNNESPMNYRDNTYAFRQDSSFLYYWGLNAPGLTAALDVDGGKAVLFGNNPTVSEMVWTGPQEPMEERAARVGVSTVYPVSELADHVAEWRAAGRTVHVLPQYRADTIVWLESLLDISSNSLNDMVSADMVRAVIGQRSVKEDQEVAETEVALKIAHVMHTTAMRMASPGRYEREVAGMVEGIAIAEGGCLSFPVIFSRHGEVLHNHSYDNLLEDGDLVVHDSGASAPSGYASDITRAFPVSGTFIGRQRAIYEVVLAAQEDAIAAMRPGVPFRSVHNLASRRLTQGLIDLGLMQGDAEEAVEAGAHALFFPHGLGHAMGLDVHDMEALGEDAVGYDLRNKRSGQFGARSLRFGKALEPGHVVTVEPGCYFIGPLIDEWASQRKGAEFIDYEAVDKWKGTGGVRIEDDVLVTREGCRVLGPPIPKTARDIEEVCSQTWPRD